MSDPENLTMMINQEAEWQSSLRLTDQLTVTDCMKYCVEGCEVLSGLSEEEWHC